MGMTRDEFIKRLAFMGVGVAVMPSILSSCSKEEIEQLNVQFNGKVLIIGAGAAGLMAAYTLQQYNIDFEVIEAMPRFGGRVKKVEGFADYPIDVGAEWIHTDPGVFGRLINDNNAQGSVDLISYQLDTISVYEDGELTTQNWASPFYREYKFKSTTWYDFFNDYIVPSFSDKIRYSAAVAQINYAGNQVEVTTQDGTTYTADKAIVTVPIKILQEELIDFVPALPTAKVEAINQFGFPPGIKVTVKFAERFYPDMTVVGGGGLTGTNDKLYIDAGYKKDTNDHVMTLFWVAEAASSLTDLNDTDILATVLAELDEIFDGKATQHYQDHIIQNWSAEPFIQGSYSQGESQELKDAVLAPVDARIYFAGEALHDTDSSTVHGAGFSGTNVASTIIEGG